MAVRPQPFRQIHLDFHTSEHIAGVAARFDANAFGETLVRARVQSVQLFARCWHGWMYYQSKRFPQRVHPHLNGRDLLREQIEACHARGIVAPIYVAVQVDRFSADRHPEWVQRTPENRLGNRGVFEPGLRPNLCLNTPFADFLFAHVDEILASLPVDGFWFDGCAPQDCCCQFCVSAMLERGMDPADEQARRTFGLRVVEEFCDKMSARVRQTASNATLFYNNGHVGPRHRLWTGSHTHFEIESLPGGGWGYLHFPVAVRQARTFGPDVVGMTGKFHTAWGDFHSFKNRAALEFECFQMLAQGARCSIGDQLHPDGRLDPHTYDLVGAVFEQVEAVEPWCENARPLAEIGLVSPEGVLQEAWDRLLPAPVLGATRLLQEAVQQFDIVEIATGRADFSPYRLLILPDTIAVDEPLAQRLSDYLARGGTILSTGDSGLRPDGSDFALFDAWGVHRRDANRDADGNLFSVDYLFPEGDFAPDLPRTEHVMYQSGAVGLEPLSGTQVLARTRLPYFERTWRHFCSHLHAPSSGQDGGAAIVRRGPVIHFAHPVFGIYRDKAPRWCKTLVCAAVRNLLGAPLLAHDGPSTLIATLHEQAAHNRWVAHLLHYVPERRTPGMDIIEDRLPLHDLGLRLRVPRRVARVALAPQGANLPFEQDGDTLQFRVPRVDGYQLVEIGFDE